MDISYQYLTFFLEDDEKLEKIQKVSVILLQNLTHLIHSTVVAILY